MSGRIIFRIVAGLVLLAAIAGIAWYAFNLGAAQDVDPGAVQTGAGSYPYYAHPIWHPFNFLGFGCFGLLIPLFLLMVACGALRGVIGGTGWGRMHGYWRGENGEGLPPMFREWHRRAHEGPADKK
jgi:hypothetical protein